MPNRDIRVTKTALCLACSLALAFSGCKVGPDYCKPSAEYLERPWTDQANVRFTGQPVDERVWWKAFNDPVLDQLIDTALANNLDLKQAGQRILEVRAIRQVAAGNLFPQQQTANATANRVRISENDANFVVVPGFFQTVTSFNSFTTNFSAAWELDFWGKYRRLVESADANVGSTMAAYDLVKVLLVGDVARTYIDLRAIERRILLAKQNIEIQRATLKLTEEKLAAGTAVKLDYHQSKSNLAQTESVVPTLELLRRQANHQLCVLLGQVPEDLFSTYENFGNVPLPPASIALGIPNDLLRRRPDIQVAERELAAQSARIGVAKADFYPQLSLVGTIGVSAQSVSDLYRPSSLVGVAGPAASWNLLNYGRIKNRVIAEQEAFERLRLAYHDTILNAYKEAQDSQAAFINYWARMENLQEAADNSAAAVSISQTAFAEGATDFNRVYLLQSDLVGIQDSLAENQGKIAQSLVNLYVSLGGGWDISGSSCITREVEHVIHSSQLQLPDETANHSPTNNQIPQQGNQQTPQQAIQQVSHQGPNRSSGQGFGNLSNRYRKHPSQPKHVALSSSPTPPHVAFGPHGQIAHAVPHQHVNNSTNAPRLAHQSYQMMHQLPQVPQNGIRNAPSQQQTYYQVPFGPSAYTAQNHAPSLQR
jgi:NodT family efflux transporter outer membrane factor (OMF) lipoprotein